jgi:hypothetical protein
MTFIERLNDSWRRHDSLLCVGLDPEPGRLPAPLQGKPDAVFEFCRAIVDATADLVCCFKPQIAHFAAQGAEDALQRLIAHIHRHHPGVLVILDAKRGDIGSTAQHYAAEAFERYGADAVTLNPYLGMDSLQPFLQRADKGAVILCHTSNPGAGGEAVREVTPTPRPCRSCRSPIPQAPAASGCTCSWPSASRATGTRIAIARWWSGRRIRNSSQKFDAWWATTCRCSCRASARKAATWKLSCATDRMAAARD